MKKLFCIFIMLTLFLSFFSFAAFATTSSYQEVYFNKLIEIREKPGFIRTVLTDKDNNGFSTETICYALNDYNQDGIPELIVYGTNIAGEAGDNYQVYTYCNGRLEKFDKIIRENQPFYPYHTDFFFLPDGYTDKETNELVWVMKTPPEAEDFWAIAGTPYENETVFEVDFNFRNMVVDIVPVVYVEKSESNEYTLKLENWNENHKLSVKRDEYGRRIPENNKKLWEQLSELTETSDLQTPEILLKNKILIRFNDAIRSSVLQIVGFTVLAVLLLLLFVLSVKSIICKAKTKRKIFR